MATTALSPPNPSLITGIPSPMVEDSVGPASPAPPSHDSEFLTNLLHAVLSSDGNLSCPLPSDFTAALLRNDDGGTSHQAVTVEISSPEGVPSYPLYKHLARALNDWIVSGAFPRAMEPFPGIAENEGRKAKIDMWTPKVLELGSCLVELGREVGFQLHVQEPYFSQLKAGTKTVEGRCASGTYNKIQAGDTLLCNQSLLLRVKDVKMYSTFQQMLEEEGLNSVLPGIASIEEGVHVYRAFYSEAREQAGVLGIQVSHPSYQRQPFEVLYDLLNGLHVEGVRTLLGMRSTIGSIEDALPPPTSTLLSAFLSLKHETVSPLCYHYTVVIRNSWRQGSNLVFCNAVFNCMGSFYKFYWGVVEVPGSKLTVGARALAKHVHRSSDGWWGLFTGTEPAKNKLAFKMICRMIEQATWLNVHSVPIPVFEIRVQDGYGARWLADGSQFRGFLEPPMEEAYLNKWRH